MIMMIVVMMFSTGFFENIAGCSSRPGRSPTCEILWSGLRSGSRSAMMKMMMMMVMMMMMMMMMTTSDDHDDDDNCGDD